jgi:hypothetical protein
MKTREKLNKLRGQKSLISRTYNQKINEAYLNGEYARAVSLKGAKTVKLRQVDEIYS